MQTNPPILLLDINVWLDLFLPRRTNHDSTLLMIDEARARDCALVYPSQAVLEVFQRVQSSNKQWFRESRELTQTDAIAIKRMAWDSVAQMREWATAVPIDDVDVALACSYRDEHDDLEDDLILAACQRSKANYLVTNDLRLITHAPIEAHTPADMLELIRTGRAKGTPVARDIPGENDWFYRWLEQYA